MSKLKNYNGSVQLMAGITQKGGGEFPLAEAHAIQTREDGTRLDEDLLNMWNSLRNYVDEQIEILRDYLSNSGVSGVIPAAIVVNNVLCLTAGDDAAAAINNNTLELTLPKARATIENNTLFIELED